MGESLYVHGICIFGNFIHMCINTQKNFTEEKLYAAQFWTILLIYAKYNHHSHMVCMQDFHQD